MELRVVVSVILFFVCFLNNPASARGSVIAKKTNVFYLLGGDGIYVIDPVAKVLHKRITNTSSPGICTKSRRASANECSHNSAVVVGDKVFIADDAGSAVHVIDIQTQEKVETIPTDPYPFFLRSLPWLKEVWVHSWKLSTFDVIETNGHKKTHTAVRAHVKPGFTHGLMVAHIEMLNGEYGYVSHFRNSGIHKINLKSKTYSSFLNFTAQGCTGTYRIAFNPYNNRLYVDCTRRFASISVLELDVSSNKVVKIWPFPGSDIFVSPNGHFVVFLERSENASQMNIIDVTKSKAVRYPQLLIPGGASHAVFYPKSKNPGSYNVFVTLDYLNKMAIVDLDLVKNGNISVVKYIENVGFLDPSSHGSSRDLFINDKWIISPATKSKSVVIINAETQKVHGKISNVNKGSFAVWVGESSTSGTSTTGKPSISLAFLVFLFVFLKF